MKNCQVHLNHALDSLYGNRDANRWRFVAIQAAADTTDTSDTSDTNDTNDTSATSATSATNLIGKYISTLRLK